MSETAIDSVIACADRILLGDDGAPWDDATRDLVWRALNDRADGDLEIERRLAAARFRDADALREFLAQL